MANLPCTRRVRYVFATTKMEGFYRNPVKSILLSHILNQFIWAILGKKGKVSTDNIYIMAYICSIIKCVKISKTYTITKIRGVKNVP